MIYLQRILAAAIFILLLCFAQIVFACQCPPNPVSCANFSKADAVFVGKVTKVSPELNELPDETGVRKVRFSVEQTFRGVQETEIELQNAMTSCEYIFIKGKTYFVYAYGDAAKGFGTYSCSGTQEITDATEDLTYAKNRASRKVEQAIVGRILDNEDESRPVADARVLVSGNSKSYSTFTDKTGRFKSVVAEPGKYKVRLFLPTNSVIGGTQYQLKNIVGIRITKKHHLLDYELEVKPNECAFIDVPLIIDKNAR